MVRRILILLYLLIPARLLSQDESVPLLERNVTICANGVTPQYVLAAIAQQGEFVFAYNPSIIPTDNVSLCIQNQPIRLVLNTLFDGAIDYSIRGKYLILKKNPKATKKEDVKVLEGYITDSRTGQRLTNASIYDKEQMLSAITNQYGYFKIEVPKNADITKLHLSKQGYTDTLLLPTNEGKDFLNIRLASKQIFEKTSGYLGDLLKSSLTDSLNKREWLPSWLLTTPMRTHVRNVTDTLFKKVQISFLPFISTNKLLSANTANDFSFNVIAGVTQEVRRFEVGGVLNIVRKNAGYAQFAGVGNIVGGSFRGVQAAGTFNIVRDSLQKVQLAGVGNIVGGSVTGLQAGGTFNICNTFDGLQLSGTVNFATSFEGAQISGVWNESRRVDGLQLSGVINTAKQITGVQVTGVTNIAKNIEGTQVAGVVNIANNMEGLQVAGVVNIASYLDGYQVGTVNIADSAKGVPFGFFSYVKKGYHKLEVSIDEMKVTSLAFRTGVPLFHNIFSVGSSTMFTSSPLWTYGYGIGTSIGNPSKVLWDIDFSMSRFLKESNWSSENAHYKLYTGLDWHLSKKISIAAGVSYNLLSTNSKETGLNSAIDSLLPYTFSNSTSSSGTNFKSWIGGTVAIRFF